MIKRISDDGKVQYKIKVGDKYYLTIQNLSDYAASAITGRATRVWDAREEGDPGAVSVVIKDLWVNIDSLSEGEILDAILVDMEKWKLSNPYPDDPDPDFRRYFLTKLAEWEVLLSNGEPDTTRVSMCDQSLTEPLEGFWTSYHGSTVSLSPTQSGASRTLSQPRDSTSFPIAPVAAEHPSIHPPRHLEHYRIVFAEVGIAIRHLKTLKEALTVIRDAAIG
jgi:hypothetical protein